MTNVTRATRPSKSLRLLARMDWAYGMIAQHDLSTSEGAVLVRLAFRAASGSVWESQPAIATATGVSRATVQRSLYRLVELGLIVRHRRFAATNIYQPTWAGTEQALPSHHGDAPGLPQIDARPPHSDASIASERGAPTSKGIPEKEAEGNRGDPDAGPIGNTETEDRNWGPDPTASEAWNEVLEELRECIPKPSFVTYCQHTIGYALVDINGVLVDTPSKATVMLVSTPNTYVAEMLDGRMANVISQAVQEVTKANVKVEYLAGDGDGRPVAGLDRRTMKP